MDSHTLTTLLSVATVIGQVFILALGLSFIFRKKNNAADKVLLFISEERLRLSLAVTLLAVVGSLTYSEVIGFEPCMLCWIQRVFMYPQFVLFAVAMYKGFAEEIYHYARALSLLGGLVAAYHYYIQFAHISNLPCSAGELSVSCSQQQVYGFGYITIPMMTLTAFTFIFLLTYTPKSE